MCAATTLSFATGALGTWHLTNRTSSSVSTLTICSMISGALAKAHPHTRISDAVLCASFLSSLGGRKVFLATSLGAAAGFLIVRFFADKQGYINDPERARPIGYLAAGMAAVLAYRAELSLIGIFFAALASAKAVSLLSQYNTEKPIAFSKMEITALCFCFKLVVSLIGSEAFQMPGNGVRCDFSLLGRVRQK
jgi:hypothetical protein